jgi:hypothetical protein
VGSRPVQLATVAGGQQEEVPAGRALARQQRLELGGIERKPLPQPDVGRMMADANHMEGKLVDHMPTLHIG